jgi:H+-transporting ATPase
VITLLNDGTLITIAYDYTVPSPTPDKWNLPALFIVSSTLGAVSCVSSLLLLYFMLDSWNPDGFFQKVGMYGVEYGKIITSMYLKVSVSDFLTLFSARTGRYFFWQIKPAPMLLLGALFALTLSSILAIFWPESEPDGIPTDGIQGDMGLFVFVWLFCLFFWFVQDLLKVVVYWWMYKINFNGIGTSGVVVLPESAEQLIRDFDDGVEKAENTSVGSQ